MTSNLPPGVTENMLPGNRPEDAKWENLCNSVGEIIGEDLPENIFDELCENIQKWLNASSEQGYSDGVRETKEAMSRAADLLELQEEFKKIDATSHEV